MDSVVSLSNKVRQAMSLADLVSRQRKRFFSRNRARGVDYE